ncbi:MAG: CBS domain-containing protein [Methanomassiliicoccales archaeon]
MGMEELDELKKREIIRSMIDNKDLNEIMEHDFDSVDVETPLHDVIPKMKKRDLHEIPVLDGKRFEGLVSFGSLLRRKSLLMNTKAKSIMENPPNVQMETPLTEIAESMVATGYRQMPVLQGKQLMGMITRMNVIALIPEIKDLRRLEVRDIMTSPVQSVREDDPAKEAVETMRRMDLRTLPVVDGQDELTGIIGVKDVVDYNWREKQRQTMGEVTGNSFPITLEVDSFSVDGPWTISPDASLNEAVDLMLDKRVSTLPVLEDGELVGIVTNYDMVELIASFREREMVYMQITGLEEEDRHELDVMEREFQKGLAKINKITRPHLFTVHVAKYNAEGNTAKYSLSGRLTTDYNIYVAKAVDWNLMKTSVQLIEHFERLVTEKKEERVDLKKKGKL